MNLLDALCFASFVAMLGSLLVFHHHKIPVVLLGFGVLAGIFVYQHGFPGLAEHFQDPHRVHLLGNLALLLPGFALVAHYFEKSGASHGMAGILRTDMSILWTVFVLSTVLDNIAAAMIGGTILLSRYENDAPFRMLVGIICASNLGGAGSPVGDTTTVMMFVSNDPVVPTAQIFAAFVATIPAMILISLWAVRHDMKPQSAHPDVALLLHRADDAAPDTDAEMGEDDIVYLAVGEEQKRIQWRMVMALLAVPGLIIGNFLDQPGLGLWMGLGLGLLFGWTRISLLEIWKALPGTLFLCVLVATAELLPLEALKPQLEYLGRDTVAILMGLLSAWFDNIPLTAVCLQLKGFDWGLLAYSVGYGGSAMWFGSSAGVALGLLFKDVYNTKKWFSAFFVVTATYLAGAAVYLAVFRGAALLIA